MKDRVLLFSGLGAIALGLLGLALSASIAAALTGNLVGLVTAVETPGPGAASAGNPTQTVTLAQSSPFMGVSDPSAPYDLRFIDEMVMHHQGAIMSAQAMIGNSARPELRDLARRIEATQQKQLDQMRAWRTAWYPNAPTPSANMDMMSTMMGGMTAGGMMGGSAGGSGAMMGSQETSDRMFLRMMIPHHQLAVDMAQDAIKNAQRQELKDLAQEISAGQTAEIIEMEGYLRSWYGETSTRDTAATMRDIMRRMMGR